MGTVSHTVPCAGARGIGTSTRAAYVDARGYALLADVICVLSRANGGGRLERYFTQPMPGGAFSS